MKHLFPEHCLKQWFSTCSHWALANLFLQKIVKFQLRNSNENNLMAGCHPSMGSRKKESQHREAEKHCLEVNCHEDPLLLNVSPGARLRLSRLSGSRKVTLFSSGCFWLKKSSKAVQRPHPRTQVTRMPTLTKIMLSSYTSYILY